MVSTNGIKGIIQVEAIIIIRQQNIGLSNIEWNSATTNNS